MVGVFIVFSFNFSNIIAAIAISQLAFTYPKLTIETLEKDVNMFKVNNKNTRTTSLTFDHISHLFQVFLFLALDK